MYRNRLDSIRVITITWEITGEIGKYENLVESKCFEEKNGGMTKVTGKKEDLELLLRELRNLQNLMIVLHLKY